MGDDATKSEMSINVCIDYGTYETTVSYVVCENGRPGGEPVVLRIHNSETTRTMATYVDDRLIYGQECENAATRDPQLGDKVMHHFKLCLYDSAEFADHKKTIEGILASFPQPKTFETFIADHIRALNEDIKAALRDIPEKTNFYDQEELEAALARLKVRLTVPQMWKDDCRKKMQEAAKKAGLPVVVLAYEPRCALAHIVYRQAKRQFSRGRKLKKGDLILVIDIGSGTADFALYELEDDLSATSHFKDIAYGTGSLCGAFSCHKSLLKLLVRRMNGEVGGDWVRLVAAKLKISEREFERRALEAIEVSLKNFYSGCESLNFYLYEGEFEQALDEVFKSMTAKVEEIVATKGLKTSDVNMMCMSGGMSNNDYLYNKLRNKYEVVGQIIVVRDLSDSHHAVACGGLLRYQNITKQSFPLKYGYAMLQREEFDEGKHVDGFTVWRDDDDKVVSKTHKPWVKDSPYDTQVRIVEDRIHKIIDSGKVITKGDEWSIGHVFYAPVDDPRISAEFVYLSKHFKCKNSDPARRHRVKRAKSAKQVKGDEEEEDEEAKDPFKDGVHPWTKICLPLDKALLQNHEIVTTADGEKHYRLEADVVIRALEDDLKICVDIMKPKPNEASVAFRVEDEIWSGDHSEFAQL
ncbi:hypothetical protein M409DRAFT_21533 [Zasmidium cellare ATCC 36951]|uniref:Uncharacterized protein n=1 Tax=Zasmidium cellare ATCC 36951 TaxID=1080233 RepID=A0A6A6CPD0_ZASCE|nr:uncharacterized protein M409DRAFT_21533 [Zasmidium cellare ATCC 36951]KAF2168088.1 hypothetical protein M409DRAFT_21533 [Zasmidium cellare ATCC 36951]